MSATPTRQKKTLWLYGIIALLLIITVGTLISAQNIKKEINSEVNHLATQT